MQRQAVDLGFVLRQFPEFRFSMSGFDDRLRLQKFIYLMQAFDIHLGYDFSWYLRGPYCSTLAGHGFALEQVYDKIAKDEMIAFVDDGDQERFEKFTGFIKGRADDVDYLEIAASMHYLRNTSDMTDEQIMGRVAKKQERFTINQCTDIWKDMKKGRLI